MAREKVATLGDLAKAQTLCRHHPEITRAAARLMWRSQSGNLVAEPISSRFGDDGTRQGDGGDRTRRILKLMRDYLTGGAGRSATVPRRTGVTFTVDNIFRYTSFISKEFGSNMDPSGVNWYL